MRLDTQFLRSRLAWRIFSLFVICALVPILVTSGVSWLQLRSVLREQQEERLQERAKNYGLALLQRLEDANRLLAVFLRSDADASLARLASNDSVLPFVHAAAVATADRGTSWVRGVPQSLPEPSGRAVEHLRSGKTWLATSLAGTTRVILVLPISHTDGTARLYAVMDPDYLLGNPGDLPLDTTVTLETWNHAPLFRLEAPERRSARDAGETEVPVARYSWELLLKPHFATDSWITTVAEPADLETGSSELRALFPLVLLAVVLLVLWLSATQIRRSLGPLQQLVGATRRIASREFDARVQLASGDEFEQLADSFNTMSDSLREQFEALEALSAIDRLILGSPELESIIDSLLMHVRVVTGCECASVTLVDRDDPSFGRVYFFDGDPKRRHPVARVALGTDGDAASWTDEGIIVELGAGLQARAYLTALTAGGARCALVQAVRTSNALVAILALGYLDPAGETLAHRRFAHDFADRLAVALSNFEREERLYVQAHYDALTRLPNRQLLKDRLAHELAHALRTGEQLAVLYIDLDNFKRVNDTLGHDAGDSLLEVVAQRLSGCLKRSDTIARLGGDEFVAILPSLASAEAAGRNAERMLAALGKPLRIAGREYHVRASIGIAVSPQDGDNIETLLKNADTALYRAKDTGRGRVAYFEQQMNARALERWNLETGLMRALQARQFVLHYQPQIDIRTGALTGVEALLRWMCPERGLRMPAEFITAAEETGLIVEMGSWTLYEACSQYARWREHGFEVPCLAINVSADQLRQPNFANLVRRALLETGMPPWALELEITESVLLAADGPGGHGLDELAALGVRVALDDFGTGYSSLSYLRRHPVNVIKIDRSFISDIPGDGGAMAITAAIVAMARSLDKETVAEGVEIAEQLAFLEAAGCGVAQGYLFSRALPAEQLLQFARERKVRPQPASVAAHPVRTGSV